MQMHITENPKMSIALTGLFAAMLFGVKLWLIDAYGNATPYWDQWDAEAAYLYKPFLDGTLVWTDLFALHSEHRVFTTRLLSLALLNINGVWNPMLQMVVNAGLHIAALVLCIALLTKVIGRKHIAALTAFSLMLFGLPYAWENTLAGFQAQFYFVLLFSVAGLWYTVSHNPLSARWWVGVVCGLFAFLSLASGIFAFAAAAVIGLVFYAMGLRKTRKQLLAVAILAGLFMLGAMLTPSPADHAQLKAASFAQFIDALMAVLGWPISSNLSSALIRNFPAFVFAGFMLWKRPPANDGRWFLLALVVWVFGQAVGISYGRAAYVLASRYLDLFAIGILVNFACLISIAQVWIGKRHDLTIAGVSIWTIMVLICLGLYTSIHSTSQLNTKHAVSLKQEIYTQNYLATGDFNHLKNKPYFHIPYPSAERLASILASPSIQAILPSNIRRPLAHMSIASQPADAFVADGYYPAMPKRTGMTLGSYGAQGDAATGEASIRFDAGNQNVLVAIPVAGYPMNSGMRLEVEQNGQRNPVLMKSNPKEYWEMAYVKVAGGEFSIHLLDSSATAWFAIGAPFVAGGLDSFINSLLASHHVFIMLGIVIGVSLMTASSLKSHATEEMTHIMNAH